MPTNYDLIVKNFEYVKVTKGVTNIREVMLFCGVEEEDITQEIIFHENGDPFLINSTDSVLNHEGDYIVKVNDCLSIVSKHVFETFFANKSNRGRNGN